MVKSPGPAIALPRLRHGPLRTFLSVGVVVLVMAAYGLKVCLGVPNADTYFHIRMGHEFLSHWSPWAPGSLTPYATQDWAPTQWLGDLSFAVADQAGGYLAVMLLSTAITVGFVATLISAAGRYVSLTVAASLSAVALFAALPSLSARPQLFSYLFAALTLDAWLRTAHDGRNRWWLIPLTWVWAMCHGMWPVGVAVGIVASCGLVLEHPRQRGSYRHLWVPAGSLAVAGLTPVGPQLYRAVLLVNDRAGYFSEWRPADFTQLPGSVVALLIACAILLRFRRGEDRWPQDLLLVMSIGWALYSSRTLPIAAAFLVILTARMATASREPRRALGTKQRLTVLTGATVVLAIAASVTTTRTQPEVLPLDESVTVALEQLPPGTPVYSPIEVGSRLSEGFPALDPVFNGFADAYTDTELTRFFNISNAGPGWQAQLAALGIYYVVAYRDSALQYNAIQTRRWHVTATGGSLVLLHRGAEAVG